MRNIWYKKSNSNMNKNILASVLVLSAMILWVVTGTNIAKKANEEQQIEEVENAINKAVRLCYSIEGVYPPNIEYLEENYGVNIDENKYIVHYEIFAQNIMPEIRVFIL